MTRRKWVLVLVIAGAVVIAGVIGIGGLVVMQIVHEVKPVPDQTPLTEADKRLLFTAADLARAGGPEVDSEAEKWSSLRQGDSTRFILYLYEPKNGPRISIYSRLAVLPNPARARLMYQMDKAMTKLESGGESYVPAPELFPGGGARSAWFIEKDGETIGNVFLVCEGSFLQTARMTGFTVGQPSDVQYLLGPMLAEAKRMASAGSKD